MEKMFKMVCYKIKEANNERLLGIQQSFLGERMVIGAFIPGLHGNDYDQLFFNAVENQFKMSPERYLQWLKESIEEELVVMSDEFHFDFSNVEIVEFEV